MPGDKSDDAVPENVPDEQEKEEAEARPDPDGFAFYTWDFLL